MSLPGIESKALIVKLKGVALSTGSACTSGKPKTEPSHVIRALGFSDERAHSAIRISVGRSNDDEQIDLTVERIVEAARQLQAFSVL